MGDKFHIEKQNLYFFGAFVVLAIIGYFHFSQFADYNPLSNRHFQDIMRSKGWVIIWVLFSFVFLYLKRKSKYIHLYSIFIVSIYFIILYGILYRGTEYGLNSHWGDNSYRLPMVKKMMHTGTFADPFLKGLSSMYPPLWFYLTAMFAKIIHIDAYQTVKFGYYLIFLIYPWLIYFSWKSIVDKKTAAALAIAIPFFSHTYLNYIYYEHIAAALFLPWWLRYFENIKNESKNPSFYSSAILAGVLLFLLYYWWFFIAVIAYPISILYKIITKNFNKSTFISDLTHKSIIAGGITVITSIYWGPLLYSAMSIGYTNNQAVWFSINYANITNYFTVTFWDSMVIFLGVFSVGYLHRKWDKNSFSLYFIGALVLLLIDRIFNLGFSSIQTRKLLEFFPLICIIPLTIALMELWKLTKNKNIQYGLISLLFLCSLVSGNEQTEIYNNRLYKMSLEQIYPEDKLKVFESVDPVDKVFLTNSYVESVYIPYYLFTHVSNVPMHMAGRFNDRIEFLKELTKVKEPILFTYLLNHNVFDRIDYIYLPYNYGEQGYLFKINKVPFYGETTFETIVIPQGLIQQNPDIVKKHDNELYEVSKIDRSIQTETEIEQLYPKLSVFMNGKNEDY